MFILKKQNYVQIVTPEGLAVTYEGAEGLRHTGVLRKEEELIRLRDANLTQVVQCGVGMPSMDHLFRMYQVKLASDDPAVNDGVLCTDWRS